MFKRFISEASYEAAIAGHGTRKTFDFSLVRRFLKRYGSVMLGLCLLIQVLISVVIWQRSDEITLEMASLKKQQGTLNQALVQPVIAQEVTKVKELQPVLSELAYRGLIGSGLATQAYVELDGHRSWFKVDQAIDGHGRIVGIYPQALVLEDVAGQQRVHSLRDF